MDVLDAAYKGFWIKVSKSERLKNALNGTHAFRNVRNRFIAGETVEDGVQRVKELNARGSHGVLDFVGEKVTKVSDARNARDTCRYMLDAIHREGATAHVAIKPSQFGLELNPDLCYALCDTACEAAERHGTVVEFDVEGSESMEKYLGLIKYIKGRHDNVAAAIQSCLRRSPEYARFLRELGVSTRLVKGAYREPPDVAFQRKRDVDRNFIYLHEILLQGAAVNGNEVIVATHDEDIIREITEMPGYTPEHVEFDTLLGVKPYLPDRLHRDDHRTGVYVPCGPEWWAYSCRRIGERPANLGFVARSVFSRS